MNSLEKCATRTESGPFAADIFRERELPNVATSRLRPLVREQSPLRQEVST
jgi:hypothetical protein